MKLRRPVYFTHCVLCGARRVKSISVSNTHVNVAVGAYCSMECVRVANRIKGRCHNLVSRLIKLGALDSPRLHRCADCGGPAVNYDHRDYSQPINVEPVCHGCNVRRGPGRFFVASPLAQKNLP